VSKYNIGRIKGHNVQIGDNNVQINTRLGTVNLRRDQLSEAAAAAAEQALEELRREVDADNEAGARRAAANAIAVVPELRTQIDALLDRMTR
jgi:hypothetical protein